MTDEYLQILYGRPPRNALSLAVLSLLVDRKQNTGIGRPVARCVDVLTTKEVAWCVCVVSGQQSRDGILSGVTASAIAMRLMHGSGKYVDKTRTEIFGVHVKYA